MIKANELRIGNWICYDEDKTLKVVAEVIENCSRSLETYSGLGLSEEILKKAGFEADKTEYTYSYRDVMLRYEEGVWRFIFKSTIRNIEYVHEMQNLYYALTRKEFEIDLVENTKLSSNC